MLLFLFRLFSGRLAGAIRREFGGPHFVMVAGTGERARKLGEALERSAHYGIRLTGFLAPEPGTAPAEIRLASTYKVYPIDRSARNCCATASSTKIIFSVGSETLAQLEDVFLLCDEEGVRTRVAVDFFPHVNSEVYLERLGFTPLLTFSAAPHDEIRLLVKRAIDVAIAAAGLVVLLPFMIAVALLVRLTSPGPAIFRQVRCGLNGRRFLFYKFRSMCAGRRGDEGRSDAPEHAQDGLQDPGRSAPDARGPLPAQVLDRRMAAAVERAERRYVAGGSAARRARRSGTVSNAGSAAACACAPA